MVVIPDRMSPGFDPVLWGGGGGGGDLNASSKGMVERPPEGGGDI